MKTPFPKYDPELVAAIEDWLEIDTATKIFETTPPNHDGLVFTAAHGGEWGTGAQASNSYSRPMFQLFIDGVGSALMRSYRDPCPACDDWSRTSKCSEHVELTWNTKTRRWDGRYPEGEEPPTGYHTPSTLLPREAAPVLTGLYSQMVDAFETIRLQAHPAWLAAEWQVTPYQELQNAYVNGILERAARHEVTIEVEGEADEPLTLRIIAEVNDGT